MTEQEKGEIRGALPGARFTRRKTNTMPHSIDHPDQLNAGPEKSFENQEKATMRAALKSSIHLHLTLTPSNLLKQPPRGHSTTD